MTVREMLDRLTSYELAEWAAYEKVSGPLGPARLDQLAALIASTIANVNRGKNKAPHKLSSFVPKWDRPQQSWREQLSMAHQLNSAFGGTVAGKEV
ncbi:phage tail assembly protein T [Nocardioides alkalitolerans]|uniref:phage tail assembly protein T n=1 Tax=Nocardioides alkalitolerans TaxID=281714 RepID=UPI0004237EC4|nr:DUF4035 domain-containing protein [Nocardioides alkalitolerans]